MRTTTKTKTIKVSIENYERLIKDRDHFQELIKCGKWSINDAISERSKILNTLKVDDDPNDKWENIPEFINIGAGKWSINDAISERSKILNGLEFDKKPEKLLVFRECYLCKRTFKIPATENKPYKKYYCRVCNK